jgi:RND family efflux transporter MFP subunit
MEIDPVDYELAVIQANARLLEAKARLMREEAEAEIARIEWKELGKDGDASALLLREPQLAEAMATVESANANVRLAERDLEKTKLKAPFAGRVLSTSTDIGQYVPRGTQLAQIYSIETAEIRLPLSANELAFVKVPFNFRGENEDSNQPNVKLTATLGGRERTWIGKIVRTEGEIDPRTRMITAVAEVENPYGRQPGEDSSPLAAGLFVQAKIEGETVNDVFELPRTAMNGINHVWLVDKNDELRFHPVTVLKADRSVVVIQSGLKAGDRVCLTPLETPVDGMKVRVADEVTNGGDKIAQGGVL